MTFSSVLRLVLNFFFIKTGSMAAYFLPFTGLCLGDISKCIKLFALHWVNAALYTFLVSAQAMPTTHCCLVFAELWVHSWGWAGLFSGEESLPRWHEAGGSFRMGCGWLCVGHACCSLLKCVCKYSCSLLRSKKLWKSLRIKYPEAKIFWLCISNISHWSFLSSFVYLSCYSHSSTTSSQLTSILWFYVFSYASRLESDLLA